MHFLFNHQLQNKSKIKVKTNKAGKQTYGYINFYYDIYYTTQYCTNIRTKLKTFKICIL